MILPQRAVVRPRIHSPLAGGSVLLEEEIAQLLQRGEPRVVALCGGSGAGKTTALRHLAAVLPAGAPVRLIDDGSPSQVPLGLALALMSQGVIVCAVAGDRCEWLPVSDTFRLAPWTGDDLIEYLLAVGR